MAFTTLLSTPPTSPTATSEPISEPTSEPISATPTTPTTPEPILATPEPTSTPAPAPAPTPATPEPVGEGVTEQLISEKEAEKLRDIALIWWSEYYPEQLQALLTQMYAWKAAGNKYETAVIVQWLEGEDAEVRDLINQLISLKNNN